jgi:hypothetical protein
VLICVSTVVLFLHVHSLPWKGVYHAIAYLAFKAPIIVCNLLISEYETYLMPIGIKCCYLNKNSTDQIYMSKSPAEEVHMDI